MHVVVPHPKKRALIVLYENMAYFSRYVYGVACNDEATRLSGISIKNKYLLVYSLYGSSEDLPE